MIRDREAAGTGALYMLLLRDWMGERPVLDDADAVSQLCVAPCLGSPLEASAIDEVDEEEDDEDPRTVGGSKVLIEGKVIASLLFGNLFREGALLMLLLLLLVALSAAPALSSFTCSAPPPLSLEADRDWRRSDCDLLSPSITDKFVEVDASTFGAEILSLSGEREGPTWGSALILDPERSNEVTDRGER